MAVEHKEYPVYGVQFHPESILTPKGRQMMETLLGKPYGKFGKRFGESGENRYWLRKIYLWKRS